MEGLPSTVTPRKRWEISLAIVGLSILYVSIAGLVGTAIFAPAFGWGQGIQPAGDMAATFAGRFARWDSGYYLDIAQMGYRVGGAERAFFPLYPWLTRLISAGSGLSLLWSGMLLSIVCFGAGGVLLYHWVYDEYGATAALYSLLWFCFFPMSFFYIGFYPEALFMLSSFGALYYVRRGRFLSAGGCIAIAGATRPVAFLLSIPYAIEFVLQGNFHWTQWLRAGVGALLASLGTVSYLLFLATQAGSNDPIATYNANLAQHWHMATVWPWTTLATGLNAALFGVGIGTDWFSRAEVWQDLLYGLVGLALALWARPKLRLSLRVLFLVSILFYLTSAGPYGYVFEGMPRHVASIPPLYIALAFATSALPRRVRWLPLALSIVLLGFYSMWFASGRWVS
jgi:hypothetical protein